MYSLSLSVCLCVFERWERWNSSSSLFLTLLLIHFSCAWCHRLLLLLLMLLLLPLLATFILYLSGAKVEKWCPATRECNKLCQVSWKCWNEIKSIRCVCVCCFSSSSSSAIRTLVRKHSSFFWGWLHRWWRRAAKRKKERRKTFNIVRERERVLCWTGSTAAAEEVMMYFIFFFFFALLSASSSSFQFSRNNLLGIRVQILAIASQAFMRSSKSEFTRVRHTSESWRERERQWWKIKLQQCN